MKNTKQKIFVAIAWPYANGDMHIGHPAGYLLPADIFIRYNRIKGNDVLAVSGSDMHGTPIAVKAEAEGVEPKDFAARFHKSHIKTFNDLMVDVNLYTNTTTENHRKVVHEMFLDLHKKGYIIKKKEKQLYCEKCKKYLLDRYVEGKCPECGAEGARGDQCDECTKTLNPLELIDPYCKTCNEKPFVRESEHFYLDLKKLQPELEEWLDNHPNIDNWRNHVLSFAKAWLKEGLEPRAITRDMTWGIPIPNEVEIENKDEKVIYVWFEAVIGYLSAAKEWSQLAISPQPSALSPTKIFRKYDNQGTEWNKWWLNENCKQYYFIGKDNIPFHTIIWPSMIIAYNKNKDEKLQLAWDVPANAYFNFEGGKFSKSKNRIVNTQKFIKQYGVDAVRYYLISRMPENKDTDFSWKDFVEVNNNELVANLGNFVHRTLTFTQNNFDSTVPEGKLENEIQFEIKTALREVSKEIESCHFAQALQRAFGLVDSANTYFDRKKPWEKVKTDKNDAEVTIYNCLRLISAFRTLLRPFLPKAMEELDKMLSSNSPKPKVGEDQWKFEKFEAGTKIKEVKPLFKKLELEEVEEEANQLV